VADVLDKEARRDGAPTAIYRRWARGLRALAEVAPDPMADRDRIAAEARDRRRRRPTSGRVGDDAWEQPAIFER
jgi:hypothetical protein